jgi:DNA-binding phage protein
MQAALYPCAPQVGCSQVQCFKEQDLYQAAAFRTVQIANLKARIDAGEKKAKIAREMGISRETLYQYLRQPLP